MRHLITLFACLLLMPAWAQPDTTATKPYDGLMAHHAPPNANVVASGYALVHSATCSRDALWLKLGGLAVGGLLYTQNQQIGLGVAGAAIGYSIVLDFRGNKSKRWAGYHLQSGYSVTMRYDIIPDSMGDGPHSRLLLQPTARMPRETRLRLRAVKKAMEILNGK